MKKLFHLTQTGIDELEAEKAALLVKRVETAEAIKTARELGDLTENAEYQSARAEQDRNDARLEEIEHILANVEVIKAKKGKAAGLGSTVTLKPAKGKEVTVQIVGTIEADPAENKISDESPIGKALLGKKEGDTVDITKPAETTTYTVLSIR
ncbi:transcription elongation factor GreA [Candidatus Saccharibacteria bacterium]|nr:MAG: transcription elongation factor GreA [Candidatus Saccharibacteria bacterium]PID99609.1 MAG: transcription elongation factor GreA [Candidatus Saccharibacteria bacterium]